MDAPPPLAIARVEPLTPARALRGPFDYRLGPDQLHVGVGSLLRVPFGGRSALGVVVGVGEGSELEPERLVEPEAVLRAGLPPDLVELAAWMAREYCSTLARSLGAVLGPATVDTGPLRQPLVAEISAVGRDALRDGSRLTEGQRATLGRLEREGPVVAAELGTTALRRLERRGLVTLGPRAERGQAARPPDPVTPPPLTDDQDGALGEVLAALGEKLDGARAARQCEAGGRAGGRREGHLLLHGVTGSGKTEVYLRAVEATLAAGRNAIVLVPEIALTPQAVARFEARCPGSVAVLHSGLRRSERYREWWRLRCGEARVCVGARSAVFAPLENIGLIVVDEEHDGSYKHEGDPRYDARTVAGHRAEQHGAVLLCGSATPRPESVVSLRRLRLPSRIDRRPLPPVQLLDMRGLQHPLHPETRMALADVRRAGSKAIVLLNRRGWSNFLSCRACGRVWMCPSCEVALVLHRARRFLSCHHCGHREAVARCCGACGSAAIARHGAGTERVEHELRAALGDERFPVFRLDADVASGKERMAATLTAFESAEAGLLVGTQMVAKGHDFPDVTLAVVLDADQTLRFPDFRAEERTFALVTQLAGRAGRGDAGGRVLVQTLAPAARSIVHAARHDAEGFLAEELTRRRALGYPPFGSLIRIVCAAVDPSEALRVTGTLQRRIAACGATVLGPAPLFRLRRRARSQVVIKSGDRAAAIRAVGAAVEEVAKDASRRRVSISVDVDPQ